MATKRLTKFLPRYLVIASEVIVFLFMVGVFAFSLYKILTITGISKPFAYGGEGGWFDDFPFPTGCPSCPIRCPGCPKPTPTPTPPPVASPTPTPPSEEAGPTPPPESPPAGGGEVGGPPPGGGAPVCNAAVPGTPTLLSAFSFGGSGAKISWSEANLATHYSISYGPKPGNYLYGVVNTGKVTSYEIGSLEAGTRYCFVVRAVNDCMPGGLSNELCLGTGVGGAVLGVTTLKPAVLGATGGFAQDLFSVLFSLGCLSLGLGLKRLPLTLKT